MTRISSCSLITEDTTVRKDFSTNDREHVVHALKDAILAAVRAYDAANPVPVSTLEFLLASELLKRDPK